MNSVGLKYESDHRDFNEQIVVGKYVSYGVLVFSNKIRNFEGLNMYVYYEIKVFAKNKRYFIV
jgi:hypothetical protein